MTFLILGAKEPEPKLVRVKASLALTLLRLAGAPYKGLSTLLMVGITSS